MKPFNAVGTLTVLTLLEGLSAFGRTSALSPFLPSLCLDLSLSMTQISGAYMLANLIAGLLLPFVGKMYDRMKFSDFMSTFIAVFASSFAFTGLLGVVKNGTKGWSLLPWLILPVCFGVTLNRVGTVLSVFFKSRRSQFLVFLTGTCIIFGLVAVYIVARKPNWIMMTACVFSCLAELILVSLKYGEKKHFFLFFDLLKASFITLIIGFFWGWACTAVVWVCLISSVVTGHKFQKRKQISDALDVILCSCGLKMAFGWTWSAVCWLCCVLFLSNCILNHIRPRGENMICNGVGCTDYVPLRRLKNLAVLFPGLFFLLCADTFPIWIVFAILTCAFIGIRISVQAYALAGRSWLATHFSKRRGFATGCVQLCVTMITASTPVICYQISQCWTWTVFFCVLGNVWCIGLIVCTFLHDKPRTKRPPKTSTFGAIRQFQNGNRFLFGFLWLTLFFRNAQNSGIAFHLVPMCKDFGVNAKMVSAAFMPISLLAVGMTFLFGHYFKRIGSRMSLGLFLLSDAGMLYAVKHIDVSGMLWLFIACTGIYWGINNIIASMVIPALFGINRIGALNGFAFGAVSLGSAVGPFFFSIMKEATSYKSALTLCIDGVFLLLCLFALLQNRIKSSEANT